VTVSDHPTPAVVVEGVSKSFRMPHEQMHTLKERALHPFKRSRYEVLQDVNVEIRRGEFFGIVGRNGSGKSTLLKCLAGIYQVDSGQIAVDGRLSTFIELGVGFNPDLAARDNVILNAIMLGLPPAEARARFERVIQFAELEEFVDLKLKNYSSGMHVRLAFAVMIQVDADILLIDEVLAVGDAAFQQKCFDEFYRMRDEGRTILFVTHDMSAVHTFCDRAMLLERGRMVMLGDPDTTAEKYLEVNFERGQKPDVLAERAEGAPAGAALVEDVWFEDEHGVRRDHVPQGRSCAVQAAVLFSRQVSDPCFTVAIEDEAGRALFATSTNWSEGRTGSFAEGENATFAVRFDNALAPGRYRAKVRVYERSGGPVLGESYQEASVVVTGTRSSGGLVDLPHDVSVTRGVESPQAVSSP
jgi:ABC-type polysaccharide/polyol phosphate transport system ATPase subunit